MKVTPRTGKRGSSFTVSVPKKIVPQFEDALAYLVDYAPDGLSPLVVQLVMHYARRKGWKPRTAGQVSEAGGAVAHGGV